MGMGTGSTTQVVQGWVADWIAIAADGLAPRVGIFEGEVGLERPLEVIRGHLLGWDHQSIWTDHLR